MFRGDFVNQRIHLLAGEQKRRYEDIGVNAKRMLNDLLSEIFSISSGNLDIIKAKIYELTAILMRAAVDIGAPLESMSRYINYYNHILAENTTFEELCFLTSEVLEVFLAVRQIMKQLH